jgi:hypothetical protein
MANLAKKLKRFIVKDYFDKLKELDSNGVRIMDKTDMDLHC